LLHKERRLFADKTANQPEGKRPMIEVYHIVIDKEKLRALPCEERGFLLSLGYSANQVSMLQKLLMFSSNNEPPTEAEKILCAAQTQMIFAY
jgi:hypothetical protein